MKTQKFTLTLNVEIDPQGETTGHLIRQLNRVVSNAVNEGLLTGDTAATVEQYDFKVKEIKSKKPVVPRRKKGEHRWQTCNGVTRCVTCFCDEDDAFVGGTQCTYPN
jgi:hypothetical protein